MQRNFKIHKFYNFRFQSSIFCKQYRKTLNGFFRHVIRFFVRGKRYLFIEVRKRTFFKFVAKKFHPKLINSCVNFNIFQKLHMLNYIMNLLYAVPKSPKWFFIYDFSLPTKFWKLQFLKHFFFVKLCIFHKYLR